MHVGFEDFNSWLSYAWPHASIETGRDNVVIGAACMRSKATCWDEQTLISLTDNYTTLWSMRTRQLRPNALYLGMEGVYLWPYIIVADYIILKKNINALAKIEKSQPELFASPNQSPIQPHGHTATAPIPNLRSARGRGKTRRPRPPITAWPNPEHPPLLFSPLFLILHGSLPLHPLFSKALSPSRHRYY